MSMPGVHQSRKSQPPLRRHQNEALDALADSVADDARRSWIVLPPGAGKTRVGVEHAKNLLDAGHVSTVVAFGPNTAIQTQWANAWNDLGADRAGLDRDLSTRFTALTYQSLAVFDDDRDATTSLLDELAPGGRELVDRLGDGGPVLLILDECHHLLDVWGNLLAELLDLLPGVWVLGLTATPPRPMTAAQSELVSGLFSDIRYSASIPAVVREGDLAPFADLVWVTTPTSEENSWLSGQAVRFTELITGILDPIPWVGLGLILLVIGVALGGVGGTTLTVLGLLLLASLPVMLSAAGARQARLYARPPTVGQLADTIAEALRETGKTTRSGTRCPRRWVRTGNRRRPMPGRGTGGSAVVRRCTRGTPMGSESSPPSGGRTRCRCPRCCGPPGTEFVVLTADARRCAGGCPANDRASVGAVSRLTGPDR